MAKASRRPSFDRKRDLVVMKTIRVGDKVFLPGAEDFDRMLVSDRRLHQLYNMKSLAHKGEETLLAPAKTAPLPRRGQKPNSRSVVAEGKAKINLKGKQAGAGAT